MKKVVVFLLTLVLCISLIGCASEDQIQQGEEKVEVTKTEENTNSKETSSSKSTEPQKIRFVMKDVVPSNPADVKFIELLEKGLAEKNIYTDIEIVEMPAGNYPEKLNLMLLSGEIPDIIYFQGGDKQIADQGLLEDLRPYIEKSEYIKDAMEPHNVMRIENYPYLLWIKPIKTSAPVVRGDWFSNVGTADTLLEDPTIDNYYAFMKELKEKDLDGQGSPTYGLTIAGNTKKLDSVFNQAFGIKGTWMKDENGKYAYGKVTLAEKEKLAFYNKLYNEGILDPEYLTKKWDTKEQAFYDNTVGMIIGSTGKVIDIYDGKTKKANGEAASLVVLPPATGEGQSFSPIDITKESRGISISSTSKVKDLAFEILDFMASPEGQMLDRLGFEGEHYDIKDGKIHLTEKSQEWFAKFWEPTTWEPSIPLATPLLSEPAVDSMNKAKQYYTDDVNFMIPEEYLANWDAMENLYKEYSADIITGKKPVDAFDTFVSEWHEAGGTDITEYANSILK